jgi:hypothetical protein
MNYALLIFTIEGKLPHMHYRGTFDECWKELKRLATVRLRQTGLKIVIPGGAMELNGHVIWPVNILPELTEKKHA